MKLNSTTSILVATALTLGVCVALPSSSMAIGRTVSNPYPFVQGDTFAYAYKLTHSTRQPNGLLYQELTTGTIATTIGPVVTFDGQQLTDVNKVFNYQSTHNHGKPGGSGTQTTDSYETFAPTNSGGLDYETFGNNALQVSQNVDGSTSTTTTSLLYGGPFILDELPEVRKNAWAEEIANVSSVDAKTTKNGVTTEDQSTLTRNADGSYTRTIARIKPGSSTYQETDVQNADGSGQNQNNGNGLQGGLTTFSAPALSNGHYVITVVHTPVSGPPTTTLVPDWFPGNGPAPSLVGDDRKYIGSRAVPAKCGATVGQQAVELRETRAILDGVEGTYGFEYLDTFVVPGEGTVCLDHQKYLSTYDNLVTGQLIKTEHFVETTSLTSETLQQFRARHAGRAAR